MKLLEKIFNLIFKICESNADNLDFDENVHIDDDFFDFDDFDVDEYSYRG